jgi:hypothetical protein
MAFERTARVFIYLTRALFDTTYDAFFYPIKAATLDGIRDPDYAVDCWVSPRDNPNWVPLRSALNHLLAQGFRRR